MILTAGPVQPRLKPGIAIQILRECSPVGGAASEGIVHGDLKPSNIMLKRTGNAKIIDIGSAIDWSAARSAHVVAGLRRPRGARGRTEFPERRSGEPGLYPGRDAGGAFPFQGLTTYRRLIDAKKRLDRDLPAMLPTEVGGNEMLLNLCQRLIAPDRPAAFQTRSPRTSTAKGRPTSTANSSRSTWRANMKTTSAFRWSIWREQAPRLA